MYISYLRKTLITYSVHVNCFGDEIEAFFFAPYFKYILGTNPTELMHQWNACLVWPFMHFLQLREAGLLLNQTLLSNYRFKTCGLMRWVTIFFSKVLCTMIIRVHEIHANCGEQPWLFLTAMANTTCFAPTWIHIPPMYENLQNTCEQNSEENVVYRSTLTPTGQILTPS